MPNSHRPTHSRPRHPDLHWFRVFYPSVAQENFSQNPWFSEKLWPSCYDSKTHWPILSLHPAAKTHHGQVSTKRWKLLGGVSQDRSPTGNTQDLWVWTSTNVCPAHRVWDVKCTLPFFRWFSVFTVFHVCSVCVSVMEAEWTRSRHWCHQIHNESIFI